ncbi:hypothetical protein B0T26DRAFT_75985 [Lasiosphaeria miniovina]|uniref:Uncharacterized protein n=1 Tax=Lasiosphaeria miniovina TaxID=1954250 RepID=A0AA40EDP7_9PEZI|nr:uncharacterized protein B0T26DRAFT_75985 [Lasiosphaeria miniovina]KAK0734572.1 hypothetical protein B0T26DRAFT_75985 [Lasiosphaeria miniovina]
MLSIGRTVQQNVCKPGFAGPALAPSAVSWTDSGESVTMRQLGGTPRPKRIAAAKDCDTISMSNRPPVEVPLQPRPQLSAIAKVTATAIWSSGPFTGRGARGRRAPCLQSAGNYLGNAIAGRPRPASHKFTHGPDVLLVDISDIPGAHTNAMPWPAGTLAREALVESKRPSPEPRAPEVDGCHDARITPPRPKGELYSGLPP